MRWLVIGAVVLGLGLVGYNSVHSAREAARRNTTICHMKQLGLGMQNYHDRYKEFPPAASRDADGRPLLSWRVHILPFVEENDLYSKFHLDEPWDSEHNKQLVSQMPKSYAHPSHGDLGGKVMFQLVTGPGTAFASGEPVRMRHITDGTSKTIAVVEVDPDHAVPWTAPDDYEVDPVNPSRGLGHVRAGGIVCALFFDGHVGTFDASSMAPQDLNARFTSQGGEPVIDE